jgi:hypothetical protein
LDNSGYEEKTNRMPQTGLVVYSLSRFALMKELFSATPDQLCASRYQRYSPKAIYSIDVTIKPGRNAGHQFQLECTLDYAAICFRSITTLFSEFLSRCGMRYFILFIGKSFVICSRFNASLFLPMKRVLSQFVLLRVSSE